MSGFMEVDQEGVKVRIDWPHDDLLTITQFVATMEGMEKAWRAVQAPGTRRELYAGSMTYQPGRE